MRRAGADAGPAGGFAVDPASSVAVGPDADVVAVGHAASGEARVRVLRTPFVARRARRDAVRDGAAPLPLAVLVPVHRAGLLLALRRVERLHGQVVDVEADLAHGVISGVRVRALSPRQGSTQAL